jgi:adenosine deaminase
MMQEDFLSQQKNFKSVAFFSEKKYCHAAILLSAKEAMDIFSSELRHVNKNHIVRIEVSISNGDGSSQIIDEYTSI